MLEPITIRIAELAASKGVREMVTNGIGSCIVIVMVDKVAQVGGMAHAILPTRRPGSVPEREDDVPDVRLDGIKPAKYADEAVDALLHEVLQLGAVRERIVAKLVGGARMFKFLDSQRIGLGQSNIEAARSRLADVGIVIENEVTGGGIGRNVRFSPATGIVEVTTKV